MTNLPLTLHGLEQYIQLRRMRLFGPCLAGPWPGLALTVYLK